jgi:WD40 repeat protein
VDGHVKVTAPVEGSPAVRAGIIEGDFITKVDGESVQGLTLDQAVQKIRGPVNSTVKLTIVRKGQDNPIELTLVRETINTQPARPAEMIYERPVLIVDLGMHTAPIVSAAVDAAERLAVTGSPDKTVRIWSILDGRLRRTIRMPAGPDERGKILAVAMNPNGDVVAAGRWTQTTENYFAIYLFNPDTGEMIHLITGDLPETTARLVFSADGRYLAAVLGGGQGLRIYDRDNDWSLVVADTGFGGWGAAFANDGRLAITAYDSKIRLYDRSFRLIVKITTEHQPYGIAFSPDGKVLAIGYNDVPTVDLLDAQTLAAIPGPATQGLKGSLGEVAWSKDGQILFAGGSNNLKSDGLVLAWDQAGHGRRRTVSGGQNTVRSIVPLTMGRLLQATMGPYLGVLEADGTPRWAHERPRPDFRGQQATMAVSSNGAVLDFGFDEDGKSPLRFDLRSLSLSAGHPPDGVSRPPKQDGLAIDNWANSIFPTLNRNPINLQKFEISRSLAIHPDGKHFILGAQWSLRAFNAEGGQLWRRAVPSEARSVNITGDGRIVVAAYSDGTIRWHRMDDGRELLALMILGDKQNWVAWTPEGFYAATAGAYGVLRWHVNHGVNAPATTVPVSAIPRLRRPDALPHVLEELETARALGIADLAAARRDVQAATGTESPPGARLHVLTVGIMATRLSAYIWTSPARMQATYSTPLSTRKTAVSTSSVASMPRSWRRPFQTS